MHIICILGNSQMHVAGNSLMAANTSLANTIKQCKLKNHKQS